MSPDPSHSQNNDIIYTRSLAYKYTFAMHLVALCEMRHQPDSVLFILSLKASQVYTVCAQGHQGYCIHLAIR